MSARRWFVISLGMIAIGLIGAIFWREAGLLIVAIGALFAGDAVAAHKGERVWLLRGPMRPRP